MAQLLAAAAKGDKKALAKLNKMTGAVEERGKAELDKLSRQIEKQQEKNDNNKDQKCS